MRKLLILTAMLTLTVGLAGCECWDWCCRRAPAPTYCAPVCPDPCATSCDPCGTGPAVVTPSPGAYVPTIN